VARDRKRAKQRQQQRRATTPAVPRAGAGGGGGGTGNGSGGAGNGAGNGAAQPLTRADLPGSLDHAGEVDEFDAALVRGAGGIAASSSAAAEQAERDDEALREGEGEGEAGSLAEEIERYTAPAELAQETTRDGNGAAAATPARVSTRAPAEREHGQSLPARAVAFLRASWAELQRVQWPNRAQVTQATAVVIGFVAIAGLYFGLADYVAKEIVEAIL
jgi:preprotein translocase subunit SecE